MESIGLSTALIWLLIALVLGGIEILTLSFFLLWPALAAIIVAVITWLIPDLALGWQLVLFALLSLVLLIPGRRWVKRSMVVKDEELINDRSATMIGKLGYIVSGKDGIYRVKLGDSEWGGRGNKKLKIGDQVRVISINGIVVEVEAA